MRIAMCPLAVLALVACSKPAETTIGTNAADTNVAMDANAVTPAAFELNQTTLEFTSAWQACNGDDRRERQLRCLVGRGTC